MVANYYDGIQFEQESHVYRFDVPTAHFILNASIPTTGGNTYLKWLLTSFFGRRLTVDQQVGAQHIVHRCCELPVRREALQT